MTGYGIAAYGTYLPAHRVQLADIGTTLGANAGKGSRVVASFDEDSTTMGVAAAAVAMASGTVDSLYFATTTPAYADKTNATAIHAALSLPEAVFAVDMVGSARGGVAALRAAAAGGGLAVLADVRVGRPGSADERGGGDGAAAFLFGPDPIAEVIAESSVTAEFLDRWREPHAVSGTQWEERFGVERYQPLIDRAVDAVLTEAGIGEPDHVVVVSPNVTAAKRAAHGLTGKLSTRNAPIGHVGAADIGLALAAVLDIAEPGETVLLVSAADGCDALILRATERITRGRQPIPVSTQLSSGRPVSYATYLGWRGILDREPPRRPEPDRVAAPPSARAVRWKYALTGSRCTTCRLVHLPPARICKRCGAIDAMADVSMAHRPATVTTFTVDRLAFSLAPPVVEAVVDFDEDGRYTLEVADGVADRLSVGARVETTFRRLHSAGGVHNYFWKARLI
ncbi:hydroxymethylglutaryl-CoA synthase [Nocardia uniformis]|uniref:Hydroxymethylglutaryl-CoA synthase n=1 Tax=Nocardia uniformis TaxID=53432 RepID=A0A849BYW2_9NOCA|nr:OB-fold domain-containing protein [Nocardia uniformis]NNH70458.1 hydroxymethylglutaryl-CoA synthase [Nocardia uniformis]